MMMAVAILSVPITITGATMFGKICRRSVFGLQKGQRMFTDSKIPVRMADPLHIEIILKPKWQIEIGPANELVEDDAVVNPFDSHLASIMLVK